MDHKYLKYLVRLKWTQDSENCLIKILNFPCFSQVTINVHHPYVNNSPVDLSVSVEESGPTTAVASTTPADQINKPKVVLVLRFPNAL